MDIYKRLKRVAEIEPSCFIGKGCSMCEIARDALIELAGKEAVIKELKEDVAFYNRSVDLQMAGEALGEKAQRIAHLERVIADAKHSPQ